jgi:TonB family protein
MNVLVMSLTAALSLAPRAQPGSPLGADAGSFDQLLESAYLRRDVAFVEAAVADDLSFALEPGPSAKAWTKQQFVEAVRVFDGLARNVDSVRVETRGDGVLETRGHIQVRTLGADESEYQIYYSRIYRRGPGGWRLASHQTLAQVNRAIEPSLPLTGIVYGTPGTLPGVFRGGDEGVTLPRLLRDVKPQYTADSMRAQIHGAVILNVVVKIDGTVGDVFVVQSLDRINGLDDQVIRAARAWQFAPGTRNGEPVPVLVSIEMTFTLGKK